MCTVTLNWRWINLPHVAPKLTSYCWKNNNWPIEWLIVWIYPSSEAVSALLLLTFFFLISQLAQNSTPIELHPFIIPQFCNQILCTGASLPSGVLCDNFVSLSSRSRSHTVRVQILREYLSGSSVHFTFCYDTVWWCIIVTWSVMCKGWVRIFKVKVTVWALILKNIFCNISWTFEPFATKFGMVHHEPEGCVESVDWGPQGQGHTQWSFRPSGNICQDNILWTTQPFC